jgi:hypothetical protein
MLSFLFDPQEKTIIFPESTSSAWQHLISKLFIFVLLDPLRQPLFFSSAINEKKLGKSHRWTCSFPLPAPQSSGWMQKLKKTRKHIIVHVCQSKSA